MPGSFCVSLGARRPRGLTVAARGRGRKSKPGTNEETVNGIIKTAVKSILGKLILLLASR